MSYALDLDEARQDDLMEAEDIMALFTETAHGWKRLVIAERHIAQDLLGYYADRDLPAFLTDRLGEVIAATPHRCTTELVGATFEMEHA